VVRETERAIRAYTDYLAMGPERSLRALADTYCASTGDVPTRSLPTLKHWNEDHAWQVRIAGQLALEREEAEAAVRRERAEVFGSGLALDFNRVKAFSRIASKALAALSSADFGLIRETRAGKDVAGKPVRIETGRMLPVTPPRYIETQVAAFKVAIDGIRAETADAGPDVAQLVSAVYETALTGGMGVDEILRALSPELQAKLRPALVFARPS
jgi:hypothetical protein